jgi:hypothetical protein
MGNKKAVVWSSQQTHWVGQTKTGVQPLKTSELTARETGGKGTTGDKANVQFPLESLCDV